MSLKKATVWEVLLSPITMGLFFAACICAIPTLADFTQPATGPKLVPRTSPPSMKVVQKLRASLALPFVANQGQLPAGVLFRARTTPGTVSITQQSLEYVYSTSTRFWERPANNKKFVPVGKNRADLKLSYFMGTSSQWRSDVPAFNSVELGELFPGVTVRLVAKQQATEKIFTVKPKADPKLIKFTVSPNIVLRLDKSGNLLLHPQKPEPGLSLKLKAPQAYQIIKGKRKPVAVRYTVASPHSYGFALGAYDRSAELTIDPELDTLLESTYFGGSGSDTPYLTAVDANGNIIFSGFTTSEDLPTTTPGYGAKPTSTYYVAKFSDLGHLVALAYFGPTVSGVSFSALGLVVDTSGNTIVAGVSTGAVPVPGGAFQPNNAGLQDTYLLKFNSDFTQILGGTMYGGLVNDYFALPAVDASGNIFLYGQTGGGSLPMAGAPFSNTYNGHNGTVNFIAKFNSTLTSLLAATYVGQDSSSFCGGITISPTGSVWITGHTAAGNIATTTNAFQPGNHNTSSYDGFVMKFSSDLSTVLAGTYIGGSGANDTPGSIALDQNSNVYLFGYTSSTDFPVTANAYQPNNAGANDYFITKFNSTLTTLLASTYLGTSNSEFFVNTLGGSYVRVSNYASSSQVYITGVADNTFPTTPNSYQPSTSGSLTIRVLATLDDQLSTLVGSTFLASPGGLANMWATALQITKYGGVYSFGYTSATDLPVINGYQSTKNPLADVYIALLASTPSITDTLPTSSAVGAVTTTLVITGSGFAPSSTVFLEGTPLTATINSSTRITTVVSSSFLATYGYKALVVRNGSYTSTTYNYPVENPVPTLSAISVTTSAVTSTNRTITVTGTNFVSSSYVAFNAGTLTPVVISSTSLSLVIPTSTNMNGATNTIAVVNPGPGGGTTTAFTYAVHNPVPALTSISKNFATQDTGSSVVVVTGASFVPSSTVYLGATPLTTSYTSSTVITATINPEDLGHASIEVTTTLSVVNSAPSGGTSGSLTFTIKPPSFGGGPGVVPPPTPPSDAAPSITNVALTVGSTTAHIGWSASDDRGIALTGFAYGFDLNYALVASVTGSFATDLAALTPSRDYFYKISATDTGNNVTTWSGKFTTMNADATGTIYVPPDQTPTAPIISQVAAAPDETSATITWHTNVPATSHVRYGTTVKYKHASAEDSTLLEEHMVEIGGLLPNTTYHYQVLSSAETLLATSTDATFKTRKDAVPPPDVSDFIAQSATGSIAVQWKNPEVADVRGIKIVRTLSAPAQNADEGTEVYTGSGSSADDSAVIAGTNYYYTAFVYDTSGNYSAGVSVNAKAPATPEPPVEPPAPITPPTPPEPPQPPQPPVEPPTPPMPPPAPPAEPVQAPPALFANVSSQASLAQNVETISRNAAVNVRAVVANVQQTAAELTQTVRDVVAAPVVQDAISKRVVPTVVGATALSTLSFITWTDVAPLTRYLFLQPALLLGLRKRKGWGQVYNSLNKLPVDLATVRLIDVQTNRIIQTRVTDGQGRYAFSVRPGSYRLTVTKNNFSFPSLLLSGVTSDGRRTDIYQNQTLTIDEKNNDGVITANIPLDPTGADKKPARILTQQIARTAQTAFSVSGLVMTVISASIAPRWYVFAFLALHIGLIYLFSRLALPRKIKSWGVVTEAMSNQPVARAIVRLFSLQFNKLIDSQITDGRGRYYFLAGDSQYFTTYEHPAYERAQSQTIDLQGQEEATISLDMALKLKA